MAAIGSEIERLIQLLAKLPGLGPRSARRAALVLLKKRDTLLEPLTAALREAADAILTCEVCGNLDTTSPCAICNDPRRDPHLLCVVEDVADLWALARAGVFRGRYHVLGGALSALDGVRIFMFSGLRGEDINRRYLAVLRERILVPIATELRHEFKLPGTDVLPLSGAEVELVWSLNARIFYFGQRIWIFEVPLEEPLDELIRVTVEHFLAGARDTLPRLVKQARAAAAPAVAAARGAAAQARRKSSTRRV